LLPAPQFVNSSLSHPFTPTSVLSNFGPMLGDVPMQHIPQFTQLTTRLRCKLFTAKNLRAMHYDKPADQTRTAAVCSTLQCERSPQTLFIYVTYHNCKFLQITGGRSSILTTVRHFQTLMPGQLATGSCLIYAGHS